MRLKRLSRLFLVLLSLSLLFFNRPAWSLETVGICNVIQAIDDLLTQSDLDALIPQFDLGNDDRLLSLSRDFDAFDQKRFVLRNRLETERAASLQNPAEIERLERELFNLVPPGFRFEIPHGKDCTLQFNIAIEDITSATALGGRAPIRRGSDVGNEGTNYYGLVGWNASRARSGEAQPFNATAGVLLRKIRELSGFIVTDTSAFCMTATLPQGAEIEFFHEFFSKTLGRERVSLFMKLSGTVRCCCFGISPTEPQPSPTPEETPPSPEPIERPQTQDIVPSPPLPTTPTEIPSTVVACRAISATDPSFPSTIQPLLNLGLRFSSGKLFFDSSPGQIKTLSPDTFVKIPSIDEGNVLRFHLLLTNLQGPETRIDAQGRKTATLGTANVTVNLAALDAGGKNIAFAQQTIPTTAIGSQVLASGVRSFIPESTMNGNIAVQSVEIMNTVDFSVNLPPNTTMATITFTEDSSFTAKEFSALRCEQSLTSE